MEILINERLYMFDEIQFTILDETAFEGQLTLCGRRLLRAQLAAREAESHIECLNSREKGTLAILVIESSVCNLVFQK